MSLTDRVPAQTRDAAALLPSAPRYAGMVDLETVLGQVDTFGDKELNLADSLRQVDNPRLQSFLEATGMNPKTDLKAIYGAVGGGTSFSAVVFADLTPNQVGRYLDQAPGEAGRASTYRGVSIYHLALGPRSPEDAEPDTLSMGFVRNGMVATATDAALVRTMVDRHKDQSGGFRGNRAYMTLVERVGHGSTAWVVGRDVLQTALRDSAGATGRSGAGNEASMVSEAGVQQLLSAWADRMLGVSDDAEALRGSTGSKMKRLTSRVREQALSVTLTDEALEGEAYLTMRDETSASNVIDVSKGAIAALRLSGDRSGEGLNRLLDDVTIDRDGSVVHAQFAVDRGQLQRMMQEGRSKRAARGANSSTHRAKVTTRRPAGIMRAAAALSH